jgi:hypothetical protein
MASLENLEETLFVDPGSGMKIKEMDVINGSIGYTLTSWCSFDTEIHLQFNTITTAALPLSAIITVPAGVTVTGTIDLSDYLVDLTSNPLEPYNQLPVLYSIYASGGPVFVPSDSLEVAVEFSEPEFDYVKGYFGVNSVDSEKDTIDTGMEEIFSKLTGSVELTNPIITVNYSNSFGIPLRVTADIVGENSSETISLNRDPVDLDHPVSQAVRDISSSFLINRDNSTLPQLVSMLPERIIMGGNASSNPDGETATDNIIFSDSRFMAGVEVEVPLEFRINDLQLSDTVDNFLINEEDGESPLDMLSRLKVDFYIENGFPLGGDISLALYDSLSATILEQIGTDDLFEPANVDGMGRVTAPKIHTSSIEFTPDFISAVESADKIILTFTLYTTNHGTEDVKVYSDYSIKFKAGVSLKANINLSGDN